MVKFEHVTHVGRKGVAFVTFNVCVCVTFHDADYSASCFLYF